VKGRSRIKESIKFRAKPGNRIGAKGPAIQ
jgi:hypothetical protein